MGKKTRSPHDTRAEISDLAVETTTSDCPLARKGDIRIIVAWRHDESPVPGVPVTLSGGPDPGQGATNPQGQVVFKKRTPGAYVYEADFSGVGARMPVTVVARANASVKRDKLVTVFLYIEETGALKVELREDDDGAAGALLPDQDVDHITGGATTVDNKAEASVDRIPAGDVQLAVRLNPDLWRLVPGQNLTATITPGVETRVVLRAQKLSWAQVKVLEVDKGGVKDAEGPLDRVIVKVQIDGAPQDLVSADTGIARRPRIPRPDGDLAVEDVTTPGPDIYLFEEFA